MIERYKAIKAGKLFRLFDIIIFVVVLTLVILTVVLALQPNGENIRIYDGGKLVYENKLTQKFTYEIEGKLVVNCDGEKVWVSESKCKNQLCVAQTKINRSGGRIICLPQEIVVEVSSKSEIDVVSKVVQPFSFGK